jgi:chromosome segregation ATPase
VVELERRVAGRASATATSVLTNDQIRNETVLDRLKRVSAERDSARLTVSELETDLEHQKRLRARSEVRLAELEVAVGELRQQAGVRQGLGDEIGNLKRDNQRLRETGKALELSRLQAERAYFDLAARILRLDDNTSALQDLQRRLRRVLAAGDPAPVEDR